MLLARRAVSSSLSGGLELITSQDYTARTTDNWPRSDAEAHRGLRGILFPNTVGKL
jgi:hypothetical protein